MVQRAKIQVKKNGFSQNSCLEIVRSITQLRIIVSNKRLKTKGATTTTTQERTQANSTTYNGDDEDEI